MNLFYDGQLISPGILEGIDVKYENGDTIYEGYGIGGRFLYRKTWMIYRSTRLLSKISK